MVDFLIVGKGLAALCFAKELLATNKSFLVVADDSLNSSKVAGALYNPVILKRFTPVWRSEEQLDIMHDTFSFYESFFNKTYTIDMPVYRKFAGTEEQNLWFEAADKPGLSRFLKTSLISNTNPEVNAEYRLGVVAETGRIRSKEVLHDFHTYLLNNELLISESFAFEQLVHTEENVAYKNILAKQIVFCEGYGVLHNPYFNYLPLRGTKGQVLVIKATDLKLDAVVKSAAFIIPLGDDLYKVGATYEHDDKTEGVTIEAKEELLAKLKPLINCDFEVVDQLAGIRPTVADRRPLIGKHPEYNNMYILNGLGTRGVMNGPYAAKYLYNYIHNNEALHSEADCVRFVKRWFKALKNN